MPTNLKTMNVAVIGLGMGKAHLNGYQKHPRANIVAICDSNTDRLAASAAEYKIAAERCFTDYKALLAQSKEMDLHGVSVALPNALHAPVSIAAFQAGLHVLCEKPMAMNAKQARDILIASKKHGRKLMINFSFRFWDQSQALKRIVDSGAIGDIYFGTTFWHRRRGLPGGGWFWQKDLSGGGPIIDLGVHRLDLAMWLMGNPRPLTVSGSTFNYVINEVARQRNQASDVEDLGCAMIRFDNGATLLLEASWAGFSEKAEDMATKLYGTRGGILQRNVGEGYEFDSHVFSEREGTLWNGKMQQSLTPSSSAYAEFVDAVLEDREPQATGQHGLDVQLILDAIYKSAVTGKEVRISNGA